MKYKIACIPGDGIGPSIVEEAKKVLNKIGKVYFHDFIMNDFLMGGIAIDVKGISLPKETLKGALSSDAVLLGAVGGAKWDNLPSGDRPEKALLGIRKALKLYANLRPAYLYEELKYASPLNERIIGTGLDILIVRELTGGIYFGKKGLKVNNDDSKTYAYDIEKYSVFEIERILKVAYEAALKRNKKVCIVDKANVLESSRLWRRVGKEVSLKYPKVETSYLYVDNCAMQLVINPKQFDVIVTSNIFGDILSDEASVITGSIGMLASASLGIGSLGLYEPIHGSAPDIANLNIANPIATILSVAMMLKYSFGLDMESLVIEKAVKNVLAKGYRTKDIYKEGDELVSTTRMGELIVGEI